MEITGGTLPNVLEDETILKIAETRNITPAQVCLAWGASRCYSLIPKTKSFERACENIKSIVEISISEEEV